MFEITIRAAQEEDLPTWLDLVNESFLRCPGAEPWTRRTAAGRTMVGDFPPGDILIADLGGMPVGAVGVRCQGPVGILAHFTVLQGMRRQGVGTMILQRAVEEVRARGARLVMATCWPVEAYLSFFQRHGFTPARRHPKFTWHLGQLSAHEGPSRLVIREATAEDHERMAEILAACALPEQAWWYEGPDAVERAWRQWLDGAQRSGHRYRILIATLEGQLAGVAVPTVDPGHVEDTANREGLLAFGVSVIPELRRRGVGAALLAAGLAALREWGMEWGSVWSWAPLNGPAAEASFYAANGGQVMREWIALERLP